MLHQLAWRGKNPACRHALLMAVPCLAGLPTFHKLLLQSLKCFRKKSEWKAIFPAIILASRQKACRGVFNAQSGSTEWIYSTLKQNNWRKLWETVSLLLSFSDKLICSVVTNHCHTVIIYYLGLEKISWLKVRSQNPEELLWDGLTSAPRTALAKWKCVLSTSQNFRVAFSNYLAAKSLSVGWRNQCN